MNHYLPIIIYILGAPVVTIAFVGTGDYFWKEYVKSFCLTHFMSLMCVASYLLVCWLSWFFSF